MNYRLSLDLGTNSIGWAIYKLNEKDKPISIINAGVRVFTDSRDPQTGTSLAAERREKRGIRRNRDRFLKRKERLMQTLIKYNLMPENKEERKALEKLNPYELRSRALDEKLEPHEIGRALFHLNQNRGFKSNRKTETKDSDASIIKTSINEFQNMMENNNVRTPGEMLYKLYKENKPVKAKIYGKGKDAKYEIYCDRNMIEDEFEQICKAQSSLGNNITEKAFDEIKDIIFFQRDLLPTKIGKCSAIPSEDRAPKALPISQEYRILQTVTDLRIIKPDQTSVFLTPEQQKLLFEELNSKKQRDFNEIRKLFGLDSSYSFSHEHMSKIKGNETSSELRSTKRFGKKWDKFSIEEQTEIVKLLLEEPEENAVKKTLINKWDVTDEQAENIANANLPAGYMSYCEKALYQLSESMKNNKSLTEALQDNGYNNLNPQMDGSMRKLPYYAKVLERYIGTGSGDENDSEEIRYGRISNPTVHRGLNQLQRLVNKIIDKYGKPTQIVIELGRELKMSQQKKKEVLTKQKDNETLNKKYEEILSDIGERNTRKNRDALRLWEELGKNPMGRCCVYCGRTISITELISAEVEAEHILPFSRTLDNSLANKTVGHRRCNRNKHNKTPYEAFGNFKEWENILARAKYLPVNKRWRFAKDAMENFEKENSFIDRQLTDTQYYSKVARIFLTAVCKDVWSVNGRLTSLVRRWTGLNGILSATNEKDRNDHRHHAIDAMAIGLIDRSFLNAVSKKSAKNELENIDAVLSNRISMIPWEGFFEDAKKAILEIIVSHKQEHGKNNKLYDETAHGIKTNEEGDKNLVTRKLIAEMSLKEIENIRDNKIRQMILEALYGTDKKEHKKILEEFSKNTGIYKARYNKTQYNYEIIKHGTNRFYKACIKADYHHIDVYETREGKVSGEAVTYLDVMRNKMPDWKKIKPKPKLLLRLHKKDILKINENGMEKYYVILQLEPGEPNNRVVIAETTVGGKRTEIMKSKDLRKYINYNKIKKLKPKKVKVNEIGEIKELKY
ncbi:type II CRISPR RNA-guided endonuclease Cas9 [Flexistipes sinusarabici]|nr:type II CRISPR RNA-guided endonuclease Cas9 [Flexistipes sinusarabici]